MWLLGFTILSVILHLVAGAGLNETCNGARDCVDAGASCSPSGCRGYVCQCGVGYMEENGLCFNASIIREPCSTDIKCRPQNSVCTNGVCTCSIGYEATRDKYLCVPSSILKRLGDSCDTGICLPPMTQCVNSVCVCNNGTIPWTEELKWLMYATTTIIDCHPPEFSNEFCNGTKVRNLSESISATETDKETLSSTTRSPPFTPDFITSTSTVKSTTSTTQASTAITPMHPLVMLIVFLFQV